LKSSADSAARVRLENVAVVLVEPRVPENIGAAARAMRNMGLRELRLVAPPNPDPERIARLATHAAADVVAAMTVHDSLGEALAPFSYVAGTTARLGGQRTALDPERMARRLVSISRENRVALVFGREDRGLLNEEIRLCHDLVTIPTEDFSSLNLAQAVMVLCYALSTAGGEGETVFAPRMAERRELDDMLDGLRDTLIRISYLNPENPDYWMHHLRRFFTRLQLRAREVSIIRGLIRQVNWYGEKRYRDGYADGRREAEKPCE
jgi:tRNA/rRNA methyltransferase